jgi:hypothetical protein
VQFCSVAQSQFESVPERLFQLMSLNGRNKPRLMLDLSDEQPAIFHWHEQVIALHEPLVERLLLRWARRLVCFKTDVQFAATRRSAGHCAEPALAIVGMHRCEFVAQRSQQAGGADRQAVVGIHPEEHDAGQVSAADIRPHIELPER